MDHKIPFVFGNTEQNITPLGNSSENIRLSKQVMRMWTSFAYDLNPNGHGGMCMFTWESRTGLIDMTVAGLPKWPKYGKQPTNFVFRADKSYVELDDDRKEGVDFINSIVR